MDWWGVSATLFAAASLIAVVWQIVRFEATQAPFGWALRHGEYRELDDGRTEVQVAFRPTGPVVIHEVEACDWGPVAIPLLTERARMDCDSERLVATAVWRRDDDPDDDPAHVGFTWLQPALMRRTPIRGAMRVRLRDGEIQHWRWHLIPRPSKWRQGKWVPWARRQRRRAFVPDMWGMPGSK